MRNGLIVSSIIAASALACLLISAPGEAKLKYITHRTGKNVPGENASHPKTAQNPSTTKSKGPKKPKTKMYAKYWTRGDLYGTPGQGYVPKNVTVGRRSF